MKIPKVDRQEIEAIIEKFGLNKTLCLIGIRGHEGMNRRDVYDDCIVIYSETGFHVFNANTDPAGFRAGVAQMKDGLKFLYKLGTHGLSRPKPYRYEALVQAAPVTVIRDGKDETVPSTFNIHKGSTNEVSSDGCQTIPPAQWQSFITTVRSLMAFHNTKVIEYLIFERFKPHTEERKLG